MSNAATPVLGPYMLLEALGGSERSMVWRAQKTADGKACLVCIPRKIPELRASLEQWHESVRGGARRPHPRLLALEQSSTSDRWPYAAYPADGLTLLSSHVAASAEPPLPMQVVCWVCELLEGLAYVHDAGFAHHDIELFNCAIDAAGHVSLLGQGVASLWDTETSERGGAAPRSAPTDSLVLWAQRGAAARDLLCVGLLMQRLLSSPGSPKDDDLSSRARRLAQEPAVLQDTAHEVNQSLRAIIERATQPDARLRYATARAMLRALEGWRDIADATKSSFMLQLLERCARDGLLPGRPSTKGLVYRVIERPNLTIGELADAVTHDLALSLDLLRKVNTLEFSSLGGGPVIALSRAVALIGLRGVLASTKALRLLPDGSPASRSLNRAMDRAMLAGQLAEELLPYGMASEVAVVAGMLHNLGRLLVARHYPQEAEQIETLLQSEAGEGQGPMDEAQAAAAVLGVAYDLIGQHAAQAWHVPHDLLGMMVGFGNVRTLPAPTNDDAMLRMVACAANEVVDALSLSVPARRKEALQRMISRYGRHLDLTGTRLEEALIRARQRASRGSAAAGGVSAEATARQIAAIDDELRVSPVPEGVEFVSDFVPLGVMAVEAKDKVTTSGNPTPGASGG